MQDRERFDRLRKLSVLMDSKIEGPFGIRFGLDAIIGIIPVFGDLFGTIISLYILIQAVSFGCSPSVLLRMGVNLLIEALMEMVPFMGNVFDIFWRANDKNILILEQHLIDSHRVQFRSRLVLAVIGFALLGLTVGSIALGILLFYKFIDFFNLAFS